MKKSMHYFMPVFFLTSFLVSSVGRGATLTQEFQFGYVYDSWNSNFIYHGNESRVPLSYNLSADNFSLRLSTSFVSGDYESDASFTAQNFSDTLAQSSFSFQMGGDLRSSVIGSLNIPTGDNKWEAEASSSAVPYIFDPSYYHGRDFGFDLFYLLTSNGQGAQWGVGLGCMRTTTYFSSGLNSGESLTPWGAVIGMACLGLTAGRDEQFNFRIDHSVPLPATPDLTNYPFTLGQNSQISGQWIKKMGGDRFQVTVSYGLFDQSQFPDLTSGSYVQDSQTYLGDRVRVRPFLAWVLAPGVAMETGLDWMHIFATGTDTSAQFYNGGGDLFGALQSITFQMDPGTFLNVACQYDYIYTLNSAYADQARTILTNVGYNKFLLGTNVGFKW